MMKFTLSLIAVIGVAEANFKSGSVSSRDKFTYGKFITRMKTPNRKGTVASFFTNWDGPGFYPGGWNEIDLNVVPSEADPLSTNAIYGDGHNKIEDHAYAGEHHAIGSDWHTYQIEWTPRNIRFSLDGDVVRNLDADHHEAV